MGRRCAGARPKAAARIAFGRRMRPSRRGAGTHNFNYRFSSYSSRGTAGRLCHIRRTQNDSFLNERSGMARITRMIHFQRPGT